MEQEHFNVTRRLHTDVLEDKYGKIHAEVLRHDDFMREAFLSDQDNIARTYALTIFDFDRNNEDMCRIDSQIRNGGLIGKAFREFGYDVRKNVTGVFIVQNPEWLSQKFADPSAESKARLSEFYAKKAGSEPVIYGTVMEVYSPDFRPAEVNATDLEQIHPTTAVLEKAGYSKSEIYDFLAKGYNFDTSDSRFQRAVEFMNLFPDPTREKFINYLSSRV